MFIYRKTACKSFDAKFVLDLDLGPELGDSALPTPKVIVDPPAPARTSNARPKKAYVEGAAQRANGKWYNTYLFPGREFDDLDEYRAAKKQRKESGAPRIRIS